MVKRETYLARDGTLLLSEDVTDSYRENHKHWARTIPRLPRGTMVETVLTYSLKKAADIGGDFAMLADDGPPLSRAGALVCEIMNESDIRPVPPIEALPQGAVSAGGPRWNPT